MLWVQQLRSKRHQRTEHSGVHHCQYCQQRGQTEPRLPQPAGRDQAPPEPQASRKEQQVLSVVNYGIAISGGSDHLIQGNRVVSAGKLEDGTRLQASNVGIYVWDQHSSTFANNRGTGNVVGYVQIRSDGSYFRNDWWVPDAHSWTGNTKLSGTVDLAAESAEFDRWNTKLDQAGVDIGVQN